jgi:membrane protease YdiL (CAAX protease family)
MSTDIVLDPPPSPAPGPRGYPLVAWAVVAGVVAFILWRETRVPDDAKHGLDLVAMQIQARVLVGIATLPGQNSADVYRQAQQSLERGDYGQRLCFAVLAGELKGATEGRAQLRKLNETWKERGVEPPPEQAELAALLGRLYDDYEHERGDGPSLSEADRDKLRQSLGWLGELALSPSSGPDTTARDHVLAPARRAVLMYLVVLVFFLLLVVAGVVVLVVLGLLWWLGYIHGRIGTGAPHGGIYAETFAVYMLLFLALSYLLHLLPVGRWSLLLSGAAALLSLAALGWPVLRGVPWRWVRTDLGLYAGRRFWLEPFFGLVCYTAALPLLVVGILLSLVLKLVQDKLIAPPDPFGPSGDPAHPMIVIVNSHSAWIWLQAFFVAGVVAPVVEETMFRGVLYRHLREATRRFGGALSALVSALAVSFVFAVIHPQGFQAVPVLMALAFGFSLAREWRGTVLSAMIAHGVHNTGITLMLLLVAA